MKAIKNFGVILSFFISFSPLIFWYFAMQPFYYRFSNIYSGLTSLGEITGLIGIAMYSVTLVMSARLKLIEDFFGGMNKVYIWHHVLGAVSFIFLLIHPLSLAFARITYSVKEAAIFLLPGADWSIDLGIAGLLLMMVLLILTIFRTIPYQIWLFTHKFFGLAFLIGTIHAFYVPSDISRYFPLKIYMFFIINAGMIAYLYRTIYRR